MVRTLDVGGIKIELEGYRIESRILKGVQVAGRHKCHVGSSRGHIPLITHTNSVRTVPARISVPWSPSVQVTVSDN